MAIYITGDTHGEFYRFSSSNFPQGKELTKQDYVIIAGDFGGVWAVNSPSDTEKYWYEWLDNKPWTTLFIDGNHENFNRLELLEQRDMFGGQVGVVNESIFHLKRGYIYTIDGKKIFTFGGGYSIDKAHRVENISWWPQEMPSYEEYKRGLENLVNNKKVDYIITHTCSMKKFHEMSQVFEMFEKASEDERPIREFFNIIADIVKYDKWFCGHFHIEDIFGKVNFLYERVKKLD